MLLLRRPPSASLSYTRFPYTTLFRSALFASLRSLDSTNFIGSKRGYATAYAQMRPATTKCSLVSSREEPYSSCSHPLPAKNTAYNRSEEHTSELQSLMRISYDVFCFTNKNY